MDLHHIVEVSENGGDELSNLIALCPMCHALYTRGEIPKESICSWKAMLVALGQAFDKEAIDSLLFLHMLGKYSSPIISGDTVMKYSRLIAAGLVSYREHADHRWSSSDIMSSHWEHLGYCLMLTEKGKILVSAWKQGDREALKSALGSVP